MLSEPHISIKHNYIIWSCQKVGVSDTHFGGVRTPMTPTVAASLRMEASPIFSTQPNPTRPKRAKINTKQLRTRLDQTHV